MLGSFGKLLDLLTQRHRRMFWALLALMILTAFAEVSGLSVFVVLLSILADPDRIAQISALTWIYDSFGFESLFSFQIAMSVAVACVIMLGLVIKAGSTFAIMRFSAFCAYSISWRLLQRYLAQPYVWSLDRNSSELSKSILSDAEQVAHKVATPALKILANALLALSITVFLIVQDPLIALFAFVMIGGGYAAIYWMARVRLQTQGTDIVEANRLRFRLATESTNGLKEIKLGSLEASYINRFKDPARTRRDQMIRQQMITEVPRFALEALTFFFLMGVVLLLLIRNDGNLVAAIPTLGIFVFAVMRLLPAVQQVYAGFASLKSGEALVDLLHADFMALHPDDESLVQGAGQEPLALLQQLSFDKISYQYPNTHRQAVLDLSLDIPANSTIGIVGGTGAGKTTIIDLALGLLRPVSGKILIDGVPLDNKNLRAWQKSIGYVPQHIYLTDDTLAANIAFGIPKQDIDHDAILRAAKVAALHDFVIAELPDAYETKVGERGVRLSGGQRQRIGIARALYHDPSLLIMDEATSALDTLTEVAVMDAVQNLRHQKTLILIAHRLSTVRNCDIVFLMDRGKIAASGRYEDLVRTSDTFRDMVNAGLVEEEFSAPR